MSWSTIKRVRRMADLPAELAAEVRSWPHYPASSETHPDDAYTVHYKGHANFPEHTATYDPLVSENGERGEWRLTGYAEAGTTIDGYRLWILRMNESTFTYGYMTPGSTSLTVGSVNDAGSKASILAWVEQQHALDLAPATEAGTIAYNVGRPNTWDEHIPGGWGARRITDPNMDRLVDGVWGLARHRLGRAFAAAWQDNAEHDRDRAANSLHLQQSLSPAVAAALAAEYAIDTSA